MVRTIINDDEKWRNILRGLNKTFYHQTVTYDQIVNYISEQAGINLSPVFDQYLHYKNIPILEFTTREGKTLCKWTNADAKGFNMPVRVRVKGGDYKFITPTTRYSPVNLEGATKDNIEVDTFNYYVGVMVD
jgi:aminopeptidase N